MKILITGATGFIGFNLVSVLVEQGHRVRALVRDLGQTDRVDELRKMDVDLIEGDLKNKISLNKAVFDAEVVFHIAGVLGRFGLPDKAYFQTHVEGTKNLLDICFHSTKLKQFIFCSTVGVLGPGKKRIFTEADIYNPSNIYEKTKVEAEKLVVSFIKKGFPATIIRPGLVYGPYDLHILQMFKAIEEKKFFLIGQGKNTLHPVYIKDLIKGFLLVLNNRKAFGQIYNIAGPKIVELRYFFKAMAESMGLKLFRVRIPIWFAFLMLYPIVFLAKLFRFQPILTRSRLRFFIDSRGCSIDKAKKELDYRPRFNLEDGMKLTVDYYREKGYLK